MAATDLTETIPSARRPRSVLVLGATDSPPKVTGLRALDRPRAIWGQG